MASIRSYKNGAGGSSGADLAVLEPTLQSGNYFYVGNAVAGASDANAGTERAKPLLTTAQALANAVANDTVVWLANHNEVISTTVVLSKGGMRWVGEGTGSSVPRLTCGGTIAMLDLTAPGQLIDNVYFPASTAVPTARIRVGSTAIRLNALQFDCGVSDTTRALSYITGAGTLRLTSSRFVSVAATPAVGLEVINAIADLTMDNVTFEGGSFQWSDYAFKGSAAIARLEVTRLYQLNGSHVLLPTGTTGTVIPVGVTGDSRIDWTV